MAESQPIKHSDLIDPNAIPQIGTDAQLALVHVKQLEDGLKGVAQAMGKKLNLPITNVAEMKAQSDAIDKINAAEKAQINILREKERIAKELLNQKDATNKKNKEEAANLKLQADETKRLNREKELMSNAYKRESKELNDLRNAYKNLVIEQKHETEQGRLMLSQITQLDTKLKSVDATVGQHQRNVGNYEGAVDKLRGGFEKMMIGLAAFAGAFEFLKGSFESFVEAEKNAKQLGLALKNVGGEGDIALGKLLKQSEELQKKGIFSDDAIQQAQTQLANYGMSSKTIEELIPKITDLAAATGKGLGEATDIVIKGINGQTKGLKMLGIDYKDTGDKAKNLALLTDQLTKFQGANAAQLDTVAGKTERLKNAWDDMKESVGGFIVGYGSQLLDFWDVLNGKLSIADKFTNDIASGMRGTMEEGLGKRIAGIEALSEDKLAQSKEAVKNLIELRDALNNVKARADATTGLVHEGVMAEYKVRLEEYQKMIEYVKNMNKEVALGSGESETGLKKVTKAIEDQTKAIKDNSISWETLLNIQNEAMQNKDRSKFLSQFSSIFGEKNFNESDLKRLYDEGAISYEEYQEGLNELARLAAQQRATDEKNALDQVAEYKNGLRKQQEEKDKEALDFQLGLQKKFFDELKRLQDARNEQEQNLLNNKTALIESETKIQSDLFAQGLDNTLDYEKRERAKAYHEQMALDKKKQEQEQAMQLASLFMELEKVYAKDGIAGAAKAFAQTMAAKGIANAIAGSALDGVEDTGNTAGGGVDGKGGQYWILHPNERVLTKEQNEMIGDISNDELAARMSFDNIYTPNYMGSIQSDILPSKQSESLALSVLANELRDIKNVIKNKREYGIEFNQHREIVESIIENGNRKKITHKKNV